MTYGHKLMSCDAVLAKNCMTGSASEINQVHQLMIQLNITSCSTKKTKIYHIMKLYLTTTHGKYNYAMLSFTLRPNCE